jgi:catechol 2,3-dioxygenase-like lactoylglutathione lyase family enzyme
VREYVRNATAADHGHGLSPADLAYWSAPSVAVLAHQMPEPPRHQAGSEKQRTGRRSYCYGMTVTLSAMFIPVHDPDAALAFYRDALGLEVRNDVPSDGFRWVTVGAPGQHVDIVLFQPHGGRSQAEGDALLSLVTQGSLQAAIFRSDDLDATFEKVQASGAEVLQEPTSQPWGVRDCAFRDPSGNLVRIAQA